MARSRSEFNVRVEGLAELAQIPGWLEQAQRRFLAKAGDRLADEIRKRAPGGAAGGIGRGTRSRTLSATSAEITVRHPGAKALEQGAYIEPKRGGALRFVVNGEVVFTRRPVRIAPKRYAARGLRNRSKVVRAAYGDAFNDLGRNG